MRRTKIVWSVLIAAAVVVCSTSAIAISVSLQKGKEIGTILNNGDKTVVATVNGAPIYKNVLDAAEKSEEFEVQKALKQGQSGAAVVQESRDALLQDLIQLEVITQECERLQIAATWEEAAAQLQAGEEHLQETMKGTGIEAQQAEETWNSYTEFIKGMGLTIEEYDQTYSIPATQAIMNTERLHEHYMQENPNATESEYLAYREGLIANAEVIIH